MPSRRAEEPGAAGARVTKPFADAASFNCVPDPGSGGTRLPGSPARPVRSVLAGRTAARLDAYSRDARACASIAEIRLCSRLHAEPLGREQAHEKCGTGRDLRPAGDIVRIAAPDQVEGGRAPSTCISRPRRALPFLARFGAAMKPLGFD
jgi:hypothetical protein